MSLYVHLTTRSSNKKTGPMPVSTSSANTCPPSCPLRENGCYANSGPLSLLWRAVSEGRTGTDWNGFCAKVLALPEGQIWRHNQTGDLPGSFGNIDCRRLEQLVEANSGRRGFTFTHYRLTHPNLGAIWSANQGGFCVNLSADCLDEADRLAGHAVAPVVTLVPSGTPRRGLTPAGRRLVVCSAQVTASTTCLSCQLCANIDRQEIVGFLPHGRQKRAAAIVASGVVHHHLGRAPAFA